MSSHAALLVTRMFTVLPPGLAPADQAGSHNR
jgi:hypothetical protein